MLLGIYHFQYYVSRLEASSAQADPAVHTTDLDKCCLSMISFLKAKYFILTKQTWKKKESRQKLNMHSEIA